MLFVRIRISITFATGIVLAYALGYHIEQRVLINGGALYTYLTGYLWFQALHIRGTPWRYFVLQQQISIM